MSDIFNLLGSSVELLKAFLEAILGLVFGLAASLITALNFIIASITQISKIINLGLFDKLPFFFSYGLCALLGVMLLVTVFKLFQMVKFW